jgi:hypothetical protein
MPVKRRNGFDRDVAARDRLCPAKTRTQTRVNDIDRAISEISDIRTRLAASTSFRGYAPEAVALIGLLSLAVVLAQLAWPDTLARNSAQIAVVWGVVIVASGLTMAVEAITRSRSQHGGMAGAMLRGAMRIAVPVMFVNVVLGGCVLMFAPEVSWLLPGVWQMLVGIVAFASYPTMPRGIGWPAIWYLLCGAVVTFAAAAAQQVTPLMAGGPYVLGHLAIAWLLYKQGFESE